MHRAQEPRPRARSPFVAAFLSLLFPGLGHAYAGAYQRALGFAAPPILLAALLAGVFLRMDAIHLIAFVLEPPVLPGIFIVNLILLVYRLVAILDAYRVAVFLNAFAVSGDGRLGRPRLAFNALSLAGLLAVILVMAGGHVVVAKYDLIASNVLHDPCGIFVANDTTGTAVCDESPSPSGSGSGSAGPTDGPEDSLEPSAPPPSRQGSDLPDVPIPPWDGTDRLNILLIGS